jgi:hypothetical protein
MRGDGFVLHTCISGLSASKFRKEQIRNIRFAISGNSQICNVFINHKRFADFAIRWLAHLKNLQICNCGVSPKICGLRFADFEKIFACPALITSITVADKLAQTIFFGLIDLYSAYILLLFGSTPPPMRLNSFTMCVVKLHTCIGQNKLQISYTYINRRHSAYMCVWSSIHSPWLEG